MLFNVIQCGATGHLSYLLFVLHESPYFLNSKMGYVILDAWKLTKLGMKVLNLNDFEGRIFCTVCWSNPPKGGQDTGVGRLALPSQTEWSIFWTRMKRAREKGLSIVSGSDLAWSIFRRQQWQTPFWNPLWTNLSWQDEPWAEFSTLEVAACHAIHLLRSIAIWSNLELNTRPKQLLGSLLLDITLPESLN